MARQSGRQRGRNPRPPRPLAMHDVPKYGTDPLTGKATAQERPNLHAYSMQQPGTINIWEPDPAHGWITDEAGYRRLLDDNRIWWPPNPVSGKPRKKRFLSETKTRMPAS